MLRNKSINYIATCLIALVFTACIPSLVQKNAQVKVPENYSKSQDTTQNPKQTTSQQTSPDTSNAAQVKWKYFFKDPYLTALIDTALKNNQQLNIVIQEINIANNEIKARKGKYLPFVNLMAAAGADKQGAFTRWGALDATQDIKPGQPTPNLLPDFLLAANVSWQVDIWKQLRNAKKSAVYSYLSTIEGKNFMVTKLIAEIAYAYYELMALDNQLNILKTNIDIQKNALNIVTLQKTAGQVTELAVLRFKAEVSKNQSRLYYTEQKIIETQNTIHFLVGKYPQPIQRNSQTFNEIVPDTLDMGIPSQLLENRPDIKQAELDLAASKLDVKVAKANFYPVFNITSGIGYEAFDPKYFFTTPQSTLYNLAGSLVSPLINRNGIKAMYLSANAKQIQAAYHYEQTILQAYTEVINQLSNISNLANSYSFKAEQVDALTKSINISINLFKSARADYVEILMTQRDALESKIELIETKKQQLNAKVKMYQVLGGGWR